MLTQIIDEDYQIRLLSGVFSAEECAALIARAESHGFAPAPITTHKGPRMLPEVRNNTRVMFDDHDLTAQLLARLRPHLPARQQGWSLCGLNERLRWYRYERGERFNWHYDGAFIRSRSERSWLTLMVYLNEEFQGGETIFEVARGRVPVRPTTGAVLLFRHRVRHTGAEVTEGRKYVLRTDVMYDLSAPPR